MQILHAKACRVGRRLEGVSLAFLTLERWGLFTWKYNICHCWLKRFLAGKCNIPPMPSFPWWHRYKRRSREPNLGSLADESWVPFPGTMPLGALCLAERHENQILLQIGSGLVGVLPILDRPSDAIRGYVGASWSLIPKGRNSLIVVGFAKLEMHARNQNFLDSLARREET